MFVYLGYPIRYEFTGGVDGNNRWRSMGAGEWRVGGGGEGGGEKERRGEKKDHLHSLSRNTPHEVGHPSSSRRERERCTRDCPDDYMYM